jgi:hypothetical protein
MQYLKTPDGRIFHTDNPEYHKDCAKLKKSEGQSLYRAQTIAGLLEILKPGQIVYTRLRSVSKSGMSRRISLHIVQGTEIVDITYRAAIAMGNKLSDKGGIVVSGCGMDMGFSLVYNLGYRLWPNGTPEPHGSRNGTPDSNGGYALKHKWI